MKNSVSYLAFLFIHVFAIYLPACKDSPDFEIATDTTRVTDAVPPSEPVHLADESAAVLALNKKLLNIIRDRNFEQLPDFIHPVKGVRLSQYGFIDTASDQGFSPTRLQDYLSTKKNQKLYWGTNTAGDSTKLTVFEYLQNKVYAKDFYHADSVGYNVIFKTGTSMHMMETVYGHAPFVSNYFAGNEKKYAGLDWRSLRLVFERYNGKYYLCGIINDEWTP